MLLGGLQKTTLIDYPGKVACTVFTVGCNFRCPFCHNRDLVSLENFKNKGLKEVKEKSFFEFLEKRKGILDGVVVTGGEPTIWKDLPGFIKKIKDLGLKVKLDTNGSNPKMLEKLIKEKRLDFVAMDIKTAFGDYPKAAHVKAQMLNVKRSIKLILKSGLLYEFRTTVVPGIHDKKAMIKLAKELEAFDKDINWVWQNFRPKNCLDPEFLKVKPFSEKELTKMLNAVRKILPSVTIRGND